MTSLAEGTSRERQEEWGKSWQVGLESEGRLSPLHTPPTVDTSYPAHHAQGPHRLHDGPSHRGGRAPCSHIAGGSMGADTCMAMWNPDAAHVAPGKMGLPKFDPNMLTIKIQRPSFFMEPRRALFMCFSVAF
ncbi:hypothetical protein SUGI_0777780 [Cryptomeria japonica]|nr:hypothetical protein SUGI_0777780 [Cryptomeria japonica]